uniref:Sushi domain-containing protein n=1 Tax=Anas platyrhynchos TaxID=8839 RepID=A0A8B9TA83_ANAPL
MGCILQISTAFFSFHLEILCSPPRVPNGNFRPQEDSYREGAMITIDCNPGYHLRTLSGKNTARCTSRGWVPAPDCVEKPCDYPVIENGKISERMAHSYFPMRIGQYVDYHCRNGYLAPNGGRVVRIYCSKGGWNPEPKCLSKCTSTICERIQYVCNQDYRTESAGGEVTCTKNGWSPFPRCIRKNVTCEPPPEIADIENGDILSFPLPEYDQGQIVKYKCASFYILKGPEQITCIDGQWTNPPVCLAACTASEEDMDRNNIELRWRGERKLYSTSGDFIEFDCKIGYVQDPASSPFRVQCMDGTLEYPRCKPGSKSPPLCHCFVPVSFSSASLLQPQLCPLCAAPLWLCPALVCVEAGVNAHCTPSHASPAGNLCLPPPTISPSRNYSDIAEGYEMGFCLSSSAMCVDTGGDRCSRDAAQGNK